MLNTKLTNLLLSALLLTWPLHVSADIYKWIDEDGSVHYSDRKPLNKNATLMDAPSGSTGTSAESTYESQIEALNESEEVEALRIRQQQETADANAEKLSYCNTLKKNLSTLSSYARVRIEDDNGDLRILTPEEMVTKKKEIQSSLDNHCSSQLSELQSSQ